MGKILDHSANNLTKQNKTGGFELNEGEINKFCLSVAALFTLLHNYSSYLHDTILLKIKFNQPALPGPVALEYAISGNQTFHSILKKVEKDLRPRLVNTKVRTPGISADIEWVLREKHDSVYRISVTPSAHDKYSRMRFYCSVSSFYKTVFKNAEQHYQTLAEKALNAPFTLIKDIGYLPDNELNEIMELAYGPVDKEISKPELLHRLFEHAAQKYADRAAIVQGTRLLTYQEVNSKANRLAKKLIRQGIQPGDFVGLLLHRTPEVYIAMLGILKCGAAYVPLDSDFPEERIRFILEDASVKCLISNTAFQHSYQSFSGTILNTDRELSTVFTGSFDEPDLNVTVDNQLPAYSIYTSGTTGRPKGVVVSHAAVSNLVKAERSIFNLAPDDRVVQGFSNAFDASIEEIWLAFLSGAALYPAGKDVMCSGSELGAFIEREKITVLSTIPTMLSMMTPPLPSLKLLIMGGEACAHELLAQWHRDGLRMVNTYGPTETTVIATYTDFNLHEKLTIGKPVPNYAAFVTNPAMKPVPVGVPGELCIAGKGLAEGYLNKDELTREKFVEAPFIHHPSFSRRLYRTGDMVRFNEAGQLEFLGRIDSQVKLRGYRIELSEIESQVMQFNGVKRAAVLVRQDDLNERLVVYVVLKNKSDGLDEVRCRSFLKTRLAAYMVPSVFVVMDDFPTLASGKVDKKQLPLPEQISQPVTRQIVNPRNHTEQKIHAVWEKHFHPLAVSVTDDFFLDLGGHSLLAAKTVSELRKQREFQNLSVTDVYKNPTIEKLAGVKFQSRLNENGKPKASKAYHTSRFDYFRSGLVQFFSLYFVFAFQLLIGTAFYLSFFYFFQNGYHWAGSAGRALVVSTLAYPAVILLAVASKWILLGRIKPGRYKLWGWFYLRWWFVEKLVHALGLSHLAGTPLLPVVYRLLGMRVGKDVHLETDHFLAYDMITIGDGSSIDENASVPGYSVKDGYLIVAPVFIGRNCFVGTRAVVAENTVMEDEARLDDLSLLPAGSRIPAGKTWAGSPAKETTLPNPNKVINPPVYGLLHRIALIVLYAALVCIIPIVSLIAFVPGILVLIQFNPLEQPLLYLAVLPVVGASFVFLLTSEVAILKWVLVGRVKAGLYPVHGGFYIRNWIVDQLLRISMSHVGQLHATLHVIPWYQALGMKIGKMVELSTAASTTPDLIELKDGSTIADEASLGSPHIEKGWMTVAPVRLGRRAFVGNSGVIPAGSTLGDGSLVGVLSITPKPPLSERTHATWFGSPAILFPKREPNATFSESRTYNPPRKLRWARGTFELLRITFPPAAFIAVTVSIIFTALLLWGRFGLFPTLALLPVVLGVSSTVVLLAVVAIKWMVMGRYKPFVKPLWSNFVWRLEFVNALYEFLAAPLLLDALQGTPFLPMYLRLLGAKIGKACYIDTTGFLEWDLVEIGNRTIIADAAIMQTHLFEDRILKASRLRIGSDCTVGTASVVLYDSIMEDGSKLDSLSLLMKGETLPAGTEWEGIPASRKGSGLLTGTMKHNGVSKRKEMRFIRTANATLRVPRRNLS
jgi:non-ribosomal peptide synthetase-like protein